MVHKPKTNAIKYVAVFVLLTSLVLAGCSSDSDKDEMSHGSKSSGKGAAIDFSEKPSKDFKARDPKLAPAPAETVHEITLIANEKVVEVSPGVTQEMWVFDDIAPAPTLRGKIGDTFKVTIKNEGKITHSMDFHSSYAAWNKKMIAIAPGESHLYEFVAEKAGIYMYHCGTSPALHHVGNGMWGSIVIDPPDLADVDHEFVFNQGELYTGPQGKPGDLDKMLADEWDAIVFNGYVNQYLHRPIRVEANERIRVWVLDGGPSENSSFHVIGTIFDTVYKEGNYTLRPGAGGSQALDLQPAQGGFVEFTFKEDGLYPFVTHKFSNASKGAMGIFQAGEAADTEVSH